MGRRVQQWSTALAGVAIVLTGCTGSTDDTVRAASFRSAMVSTGDGSSSGQIDGMRATELRSFRGGQASLRPAPADLGPGRDADEAYEVVARDSLIGVSPGARPTEAIFGLFSDMTYGHVGVDGLISPTLVDRAAWVYVFDGVPMMSSGPPPIAGAPSTPRPPVVSTAVVVVDAETGEPLIGFTDG